MKSIGYLGLLGVVHALIACSGEAPHGATTDGASGAAVAEVDDAPNPALDDAPIEASYIALNKLAVAEQSVAFYGYEREAGAPAIFVRSYSPTFQTSVLDQLLEQEGLLTSLETFLALADEDATPHPLLVASHEQQARDSMRTDVSVRKVRFEPARVEKVSAGSCDSFIFDSSFLQNSDPTLFGGEWGYFLPVISKGAYNTTSRRDICATTSNCALTFKKNTQAVGTCADGNTSSRSVVNFGTGWGAGPWESFGPGGVRWVFYYPGGQQIASVQTNAATTDTYYQRANQLQWLCTASFCNFPSLQDQRYP